MEEERKGRKGRRKKKRGKREKKEGKKIKERQQDGARKGKELHNGLGELL